jgi:hypothetical protein
LDGLGNYAAELLALAGIALDRGAGRIDAHVYGNWSTSACLLDAEAPIGEAAERHDGFRASLTHKPEAAGAAISEFEHSRLIDDTAHGVSGHVVLERATHGKRDDAVGGIGVA